MLVTTALQYRRKVAPQRHEFPGLKHVLLVDGDRHPTPNTLDLHTLLAGAADEFEIVPTSAEDLALLHFTSGKTGTSRGAMHVHGAVLTHYASSRYALDLHSDDIYWCTADPGLVTGRPGPRPALSSLTGRSGARGTAVAQDAADGQRRRADGQRAGHPGSWIAKVGPPLEGHRVQ